MLHSYKQFQNLSTAQRTIPKVNTVVIGAGPTGLAASYLLKEQGIEHLILEREAHIVPNWTALWDNYHIAMPADKIEMPGVNLAALFGPKTHLSKSQAIQFFNQYAIRFELPISCSTEVLSLEHLDNGQFIVRTSKGELLCENVICCLGPRQEPKLGHLFYALKSIPFLQVMHSKSYRSCSGFTAGARVLVVGSGLSALSIAKDIADHGFDVMLACGASQEEILSRNQHLYKEGVNTEIVPTIASLEEMGVLNLGRLIGVTEQGLFFQQDTYFQSWNPKDFDTVIFASGFELSYTLLNKILNMPGKEIISGDKRIQSIPGLYVAGIPEPLQQTVLLSQGSAHAKEIVNDIVQRQPKLKLSLAKL